MNMKNQRMARIKTNKNNLCHSCNSLTLFLIAFALFSLSCEQPFKAGLGPVVDVRPPTVRLDAPGAGSYIWGKQAFIGFAEDDYILEKVEFMVTNYPDERNPYQTYQPANMKKKAPNKADWKIEIDTFYFTREFGDGDLKIRIKATDSAGKTAETDEIVFIINNELPAITLMAPYIARGIADGEAGGAHLNYGNVDDLPAAKDYQRIMTQGNLISGTISFDEDIYTGPEEGDQYPPQIRIWPIDMNEDDPNSWPPGVLPPVGEVPWQAFTAQNETLFALGVGNYQFIRELPEAGRFYGFEIRAQSKDGRASFHYPRDFYLNHETNENRYVLIFVNIHSEFPVVELYALEDLFGPYDNNKYGVLADDDGNELNDAKAHPYVNKDPVSKNGAFTLRLKASHSDRIQSAEAYWVKEGTDQRGRFIWDPADISIHGWDASLNNVETSKPYSHWGLRDPHTMQNNFYTTRNFIFTYHHDGKDGKNRIPDDDAYHAEVRGKSRIQVYKGSDWEGRKSGLWPQTGADDGDWVDIEEEGGVLTEGLYTIEVYARSRTGAAMKSPFTCSIRLDETPPEAEITAIDGAYSRTPPNGVPLEVTVNGVVQPSLRFSDSRPLDSGLRSAVEPYYRRGSGAYGYEQRYILVGEGDNVQMDRIIAGDKSAGGWWPPTPASADDPLTEIPGVTVYKHGPIFDSAFKFKSSPLYSGNPAESAGPGAEQTLADGIYWLYVFVRDNAFNVRHITPLKVIVKAETDIPELIFPEGEGLINGSVTDPNVRADGTAGGFWYNGTLRNRLRSNTAIRLTLKDDDSLDLGAADDAAANGGDPSMVTITFTGSKIDGGSIVADETKKITFDDATVKEIFAAQPPSSQPPDRRAIRERTGSITQTLLLQLMRDSGNYGDLTDHTSIPDGIYQMHIAIQDYSPHKLTMGTGAAEIARNEITFWAAADSVNPDITEVKPDSMMITPENGIKQDVHGIILSGKVTDLNGPITVRSFIMTDNAGQPIRGAWLYPQGTTIADITIDGKVNDQGLWEGEFAIPIRMDMDVSAVYNITLQLQDRFGRFSEVRRQYEYDVQPPTVDMRRKIDSFARDLAEDEMGAHHAVSDKDENKLVLTNGVTRFILNATDNQRVAEVRWWLLKANGAAAFNGWKTIAGSDEKSGALDGNFNTPQYIDTTFLADATEYWFYAMALDAAGNLSDGGKDNEHYVYNGGIEPLQKVYVLQEQDKPWFGSISIGGAVLRSDGGDLPIVGETNMIVRGAIYEDDGFAAGAALRQGSIDIQVSDDNSNWSDWITIPDNNITLLGSKNINLNIDLGAINDNKIQNKLKNEGQKWFKIQAADSWYGKYIDENGTRADGTNGTDNSMVSREKSYTFMLDKTPPVIEITTPARSGLTFGASADKDVDGGLKVTGSISDANLKKEGNNYYIKYWLGGGEEINSILLGAGAGDGYIPAIGGITGNTVNFTIPASVFAGASALNFAKLESGAHSITFMVEDLSGKNGTFPLSFIKDVTGPELKFLNIKDDPPATLDDGGIDWLGETNYFNIPRGDALTVLRHDGGAAPFITGSFTDDFSNVDKTSFKVWFDGDSANKISIAAAAQLEGTGKYVRWTVYLTDDGLPSGTPSRFLSDGVHTISMEIADDAGNVRQYNRLYGFRINSKMPEAAITNPPSSAVFGDKAGTLGDTIVFSLKGTAQSRSLHGAELTIQYADTTTNTTTQWKRPIALDDGTLEFIDNGNKNRPQKDILETLTWTYAITRQNLLDVTKTVGLIKEGVYEVSITAIDMNGVKSEETNNSVWSFTIDHSPPVFTLSNLLTEPSDFNPGDRPPAHWLTDKARRNVLRTHLIRGRISDNWSDVDTVKLQIGKWNYANNRWEIYDFAENAPDWQQSGDYWTTLPNTAPSREYPLNWNFDGVHRGEPDDGYYFIRLRAKDSAGNDDTSVHVYFFLDNTVPRLEPVNPENSWSSRIRKDNLLPFNVDVEDANGIEAMRVTVAKANTSAVNVYGKDGALPAAAVITAFTITYEGKWRGQTHLQFIPGSLAGDPENGLPDGAYVITFEVTDLAGNTASANRTFTLDNRPPSAEISNPRFVGQLGYYTSDGMSLDPSRPGVQHYFAGETIYGGGTEDIIIRGTTDDVGAYGSASGVAGIWYRLGYGAHTALPPPEDIEAWAIADVTGVTVDNGALSDVFFDNAAQSSGENSVPWFKYAPNGTGYDVPPGFRPLPSPPTGTLDLYNWALNAGAGNQAGINLSSYATTEITVKGLPYNNAKRRMVLPVNENTLPSSIKKNGLFSLPLVIRIVDYAGNVSYELRDIWLYPNGDIPGTVIINPSDRYTGFSGGTGKTPRGGMVGIEGVASDNVSVRTVIYRVKADSAHNANNEKAGTAPSDDHIIRFADMDAARWEAQGNEYTKMKAVWDTKNMGVSPDGWYMAALESLSFAPNMPWSFMLDASTPQFQKLIAANGFKYPANEIANNMIRVWVEVLVFDGVEAALTANYKNISLGDDNIDAGAPKPYIREFYVKSSAPAISGQEITILGRNIPFDNNDFETYVLYDVVRQSAPVRGGQFAIKANLNGGGGTPIGQISVKLSGESDNGWQTVYDSRDASPVKALPGISLNGFNGGAAAAMTCAFDSKTDSSTADFRSIRDGRWKTGGGKFTVDIRVRDIASPPGETSYTFEIGIDNFAPIADTVRMITSSRTAGSNQTFIGRVFDYYRNPDNPLPEYRSIEKIYAWFTKGRGAGGKYIKLTEKENPDLQNVAAAPMSALYDRIADITYTANGENILTIGDLADEGKQGSFNVPGSYNADGALTVNASYVKVMYEGTAADQKITWQPSKNGDIFWSFETDTTVMPDGWITLNYIVVDHTGNASYYTQQMVVMNNYPRITRVTLYTDNTGEGAAFTPHEGNEAYSDYPIPEAPYHSGYLNSGFISKNSVIGFGVDTISGNAPLHYRARYVKRYRVPLTTANLTAMANRTGNITCRNESGGSSTLDAGLFANLYTINETQGATADTWKALGAHAANPSAGTHFVLLPGAGMFSRISANAPWTTAANYENAYVYAYREMLTPREALNRAGPAGSPADANHVDPKDLYFSGSDFDTADPDKINEGTAFFLIKVWDTVDNNEGRTGKNGTGFTEDNMLYDTVIIGIKVYLTDTERPIVRLYDLNPYTETAVTGNNVGDDNRRETLEQAAAPTAIGSGIGSNIRRGGLYNIGAERAVVKSGYIEPRTGTTALNPQVNDRLDPSGSWSTVIPDGYYAGDADSKPYPDADSSVSGNARDLVSGKVLLRGAAWDDQLIDEIKIQIGGTTEKTILKLKDTEQLDKDGSPVMIRKMMSHNGAQAWAFEDLHWERGHTVEWAYLWDTEKEPDAAGTPRQEVQITVSVKDMNGNNKAGLVNERIKIDGQNVSAGQEIITAETSTKYHNIILVDIVPYVIGFERDAARATPLYATKRSRQGWYSFFRGEENIEVRGYNLGMSALAIDITHGDDGAQTGTVTNMAADYKEGRHLFTVPPRASSGKINVNVINNNGSVTPIHNHASDHAHKSWNREYNAYTAGSDLWINKPYAHIWHTGAGSPQNYIGSSRTLQTPGMDLAYMEANGILHGAWAVYGNAGYYYSTNIRTDRQILRDNQIEPYSETDISMYNGTGTPNVTVVYQADGSPRIALSSVMTDTGPTTISTTAGSRPTQRWQNNRISKAAANHDGNQGNAGRVYMTSYDAYSRALWFAMRYRNSGGGHTTLEAVIDGSPITNITSITAAGLTTASTNAGQYSAVDYDSTGPIIAYYDQQNDTVRIAFGSHGALGSTNTITWARRYLLPEGHALRRGSGQYISIKVDRREAIHLAFYNSAYNTVVYAYARNRAALNVDEPPAPSAAFNYGSDAAGEAFYVCTIDNVVRGGQRTDISVDNRGNPMIVYADSSRMGSYDGIRIAYRIGARSAAADTNSGLHAQNALYFNERPLYCPVTGADITGWEALSMPADYKVNDDRLNIEVWPASNRGGGGIDAAPSGALGAAPGWSAAIGYASDMFRVGYFYYPTWKDYN
jgi:hypothetical protein